MRFGVLLFPLMMGFLSWRWRKQGDRIASLFAAIWAGALVLVWAVRMVFS